MNINIRDALTQALMKITGLNGLTPEAPSN